MSPRLRQSFQHCRQVPRVDFFGLTFVARQTQHGERNLILIRGAVPGAEGGQVIVRPSVKAARAAKRKRLAPSKAGDKKAGAKK